MLPCLIILNLCTPGSPKSKSYAINAVRFLAVCRFSNCADNLPIPLTTAYSRLNPERDRQQFRARGLFFWQYLGQRNQLGRLGESLMRRNWLIAAAFILLMSGPSFSQEWTQYTSRTDFFAVDFPGEPKVQDISYGTEYGITLPGRVYTVQNGASRYSATVVDYKDTQKIHTARAEQCRKNGGEGDACQNDWRPDVQGSIVYASWKFFQRNAKVTHYAWYVSDLIEGQRLQLLNTDASVTFAAIHRHGTRLYVFEATVPKGAPPPGLFQQSLQFLDEEGKPVRYRTYYTTGYSEEWKFPAPPPPRTR